MINTRNFSKFIRIACNRNFYGWPKILIKKSKQNFIKIIYVLIYDNKNIWIKKIKRYFILDFFFVDLLTSTFNAKFIKYAQNLHSLEKIFTFPPIIILIY